VRLRARKVLITLQGGRLNLQRESAKIGLGLLCKFGGSPKWMSALNDGRTGRDGQRAQFAFSSKWGLGKLVNQDFVD